MTRGIVSYPTPMPEEDLDYIEISKLLYELSGINLGPEKINLMRARLTRRIRETESKNIRDYLNLLNSPHGQEEHPHLISALTTNYTNFFREPHHFKILTDLIIPDLTNKGRQDINILSAGCSSGQEPVSIAIAIADHSKTSLRKVKIVGTDIDTDILKKASSFTYTDQEVSSLSPALLRRHFTTAGGRYRAEPHIREAIKYREMNLNARWSTSERHDIIFYRNVAIYFDHETQIQIWNRIINTLPVGGYLLVGHSERVPDTLRKSIRQFSPNSYQKTSP